MLYNSPIMLLILPQKFYKPQLKTWTDNLKHELQDTYSKKNVIILCNLNFCSYTVTLISWPRTVSLQTEGTAWLLSVETTGIESESPSFKKSAYYASIILDAQKHLLCSKLCQHNVSRLIPLPPLSQSFTPLFCCLCSTSSSVSFVSAPLPIFLLLRWFESSSRVAVGIHVLKELAV